MSDSFVTLKQSSFQIPKYLTVTSIDLCDGYALVGCDNGEIICFHTSESHNYAVVGHITAKAYSNMHTIVRVTDDNRYCFVGTRKGEANLILIAAYHYKFYPIYGIRFKRNRSSRLIAAVS